MRNSVVYDDLCNIVKEQIDIKQKQFNCFITLYMADADPIVEMDVLYLDPVRTGGRKVIATDGCAATVASGIIRYFKEGQI